MCGWTTSLVLAIHMAKDPLVPGVAASPVHIPCCGDVSYSLVRDLVLVCEGSLRLGGEEPLTPKGQGRAEPHLFLGLRPTCPEVTFWGRPRRGCSCPTGEHRAESTRENPRDSRTPDPRLLHSEKTKPCLLSFFAIIQMEGTNEIFSYRH